MPDIRTPHRHRLLTLALATLALGACGAEATATPAPAATPTATEVPAVVEPITEESLRAMVTRDEIEAALGFEIAEATFINYFETIDPTSDSGMTNFLGMVYLADGGRQGLTVSVIEFLSDEYALQHKAIAMTDQEPIAIDRQLGDDSLVI